MKIRVRDVEIDLDRLRDLGAGGQVEARLVLQELETLRRANPMEFFELPGAKHEPFLLSTKRLKAAVGANRSAKTTTAILDSVVQVTPDELVPAHMKAYKQYQCPCFIRVMAPDMERTMKPVIHEKLKDWLPRALIPKGWERHYTNSANSLTLECGCRFDFLSYEMDLNKFGGAALHRCHYDEEPPEKIRNECLVRLADYNGDELFTFTALHGLRWAHRRIIKNASHPALTVVHLSMRDNKFLSQQGVARMYDPILGLDPMEAGRRLDGHFLPEFGLVYPFVRDWLCPPVEPRWPKNFDTLIGIDPGIRVCGITATSWDGERFVTFDAIELEGKDVGGYKVAIDKLILKWDLDPDRVFYGLDPNNVAARALTSGTSVEDELVRMGITVERAPGGGGSVDDGCLQLSRLGRQGLWRIADNLTLLIERLEEYPLDEWVDGTLHPAKTGREHLCDSVRYGITIRSWPDPDDEPADPYPGGQTASEEAYGPPRPLAGVPGVAGDMV